MSTLQHGTDSYWAPEQRRDFHPSSASDIYALGRTLYELLLPGRLKPREYDHDSILLHPSHFPSLLMDIPSDFSAPFPSPTTLQAQRLTNAADLIRRMLAYDAADRPTADEALKHALFQ